MVFQDTWLVTGIKKTFREDRGLFLTPGDL